MIVYINYQTETELIEGYVASPKDFKIWTANHLRTKGHKLFVVLPGKDPKEVFMTTSITDIDLFFEFVNMDKMLFIQEFEYGDYKDALGFLSDLFEVSERGELPPPMAN